MSADIPQNRETIWALIMAGLHDTRKNATEIQDYLRSHGLPRIQYWRVTHELNRMVAAGMLIKLPDHTYIIRRMKKKKKIDRKRPRSPSPGRPAKRRKTNIDRKRPRSPSPGRPAKRRKRN